MKKNQRDVIYSFPVQLFLLHFKKHPLLLLYWILLLSVASNSFAKTYGGPYLLLDPEYMGEVSPLSFLIVGFAIGGFIMTWNTCFYMLNSFRFKFLASLNRPFVKFCFNNLIIPVIFTATYIITLIRFQLDQQLLPKEIAINVLSILAGQLLMVIVVVLYFTLLNKNVERFIATLTDKTKVRLEEANIYVGKLDPDRPVTDASQWPVETYLSGFFRARLVRKVDHYDAEIVKRVLRQHHMNTLLIIFICIFSLMAYGYLLDNPVFRFPAGASLMLIFSVAMALSCVISYWAGGWRIIVFILLMVGLNWISNFNLVVYKHKLFGIDYKDQSITYSNKAVYDHITTNDVLSDIKSTTEILDNWYAKVRRETSRKPYIVFIQSSGGGTRASYWGMHVLQQLQKGTDKKLMKHTIMMSGASGGMLGSAYFRELYFREQEGESIDPLAEQYREDAGKDILNAVFSAIAVNDLFFPWQHLEIDSLRYRKDRGYWFDKQLNENTNGFMSRRITEYGAAERKAEIPVMILSPTIVNDQRILVISAQPVSYLAKPYTLRNKGFLNYLVADGVEFMRFFKDKGAEHLNLLSALRMNATYPYILPAVSMPTTPEMKVMDAGLRENHGFGMTTRFVNVFRKWIEDYTAGVVIIQIRSDQKLKKMEKAAGKSNLLSELMTPFGNIYSNFLTQQDYINDYQVAALANSLKVPVHILPFIYVPSMEDKAASMSLHLTKREKKDIVAAFDNEGNQAMLARLKLLLNVK